MPLRSPGCRSWPVCWPRARYEAEVAKTFERIESLANDLQHGGRFMHKGPGLLAHIADVLMIQWWMADHPLFVGCFAKVEYFPAVPRHVKSIVLYYADYLVSAVFHTDWSIHRLVCLAGIQGG